MKNKSLIINEEKQLALGSQLFSFPFFIFLFPVLTDKSHRAVLLMKLTGRIAKLRDPDIGALRQSGSLKSAIPYECRIVALEHLPAPTVEDGYRKLGDRGGEFHTEGAVVVHVACWDNDVGSPEEVVLMREGFLDRIVLDGSVYRLYNAINNINNFLKIWILQLVRRLTAGFEHHVSFSLRKLTLLGFICRHRNGFRLGTNG